VQNVIPAGFKFHQASQGGKYQEAARTVSWTLGDLLPGQVREITFDVVPTAAGEHRLTALAKSARGLKTEAEARTRVEGVSSLLIELADADDPIEVGAETSYELRVSNTGTKTESNVEVVCSLPDQLEFRVAKCSATLKYRLEGRELIFEPLPRLAPKADVIYRIQVKGIAPGDVRFRTRVRADDLREPIVREERTRIYSDDTPLRSTPVSMPSATSMLPSSAPVLIPSNPPATGPSLTPVTHPSLPPSIAPAPGSTSAQVLTIPPVAPMKSAPSVGPVSIPAPVPQPTTSPVLPAPGALPPLPSIPVMLPESK
jgi:hypothetical protein